MLVLGDAHAADPENRRRLLAAYEASGAEIALHVGDLEYYDLPVPTWFVAGNNEDFDVIDALRSSGTGSDTPEGGPEIATEVRNAHLIASDLVEVRGLTVLGLSGNYAPTRYDYDRADLADDRRRHFTRAEVERAIERGREVDVDLLLTHAAPHGLVSYSYDPGIDAIDELIGAVEPSLCLVGHHHTHAELTIGETRVVSLAPVWERYYDLDPATLTLERFETPSERE
ncbi:metallophosphoesterase family protein [Halosimplex salinum]|uniref:metallophosphoesterase family protein n=1 Tax=Halosimplex salinum TaxID=1710538 RepID=UPI000F46C927|nr:metallophosphoesterase [Halosimplex salinum]